MTETKWPFGHFRLTVVLILISLIKYVSPDALGIGESVLPTLGVKLDSYPYNVTINHLSPHSVEVSWNCRSQNSHDKYEVTLKPLEARVIETVPFNICFIKLERLDPNTSYQVSVAFISGRVRKRSSSVIFRTYMELDGDYGEIANQDTQPSPSIATPTSPLGNKDRLRLPRVRLVEVSLVGMALILWAGAIVLFFHRWGKIRMLLPYQPDYKEMKRSNSVCVNCSMTPHHQTLAMPCTFEQLPSFDQALKCCRIHQQLPYAGAEFVGPLVKADFVTVPVTDTGCSPIRPRLNSFVVHDIKEHPPIMSRRSKSAEHLEHYTYLADDPDASCGTDFTGSEY